MCLNTEFSSLTRYAMRVSYVGTQYAGWQTQTPNLVTIQKTFEDILTQLHAPASGKKRVVVFASGRTDSGVHAVGQVVHFDFFKRFEPEQFLKALNAHLPKDIRVLAMVEAPPAFHAQRDATSKQYSYYLQTGPAWLPHLEPYSHWIPRKPRLDHLQKAANLCIGVRDFACFQGAKAATKTTVREITAFEVTEARELFLGAEYPLLRFRVVGTGFLKQMVRSLVGTVLEVGLGGMELSDFELTLQPERAVRMGVPVGELRQTIGETLPAKGLFLEKVWYKTDPLCNTP